MMSARSNSGWALLIPKRFAETLAPLRLISGLEIGEDSESLWLRARTCTDPLPALLAALPAQERFTWLERDILRPVGSRLATARLPVVDWIPLQKWFRVALPVAGLPGQILERKTLHLIPSNEPQAVNAITTTLENWANWAKEAPALRLKRLRFAASTQSHVIVLGVPPPPIQCRPMIERFGVIIPAGFAWAPAVSAATVRRVMGASENTLILWNEEGAELLGEELFIPASRAAARTTAKEIDHAPL